MKRPFSAGTLAALTLAAAVLASATGVSFSQDKGKAVEPFNGKDLSGWRFKGDAKNSKWAVGKAEVDPADPRKLVVKPGGCEMIDLARSLDMYTEQKFGDAVYELEVMVPKGSNSGIYILGEYEVQILDSFGQEQLRMGDMGGLYGFAAPKTNACKAPGQWQTYRIDYRAPRFDATGKKIANAKVLKVVLNGQVIHENVELPRAGAGGLTGREVATGPLMFQGNHGPVAFRNIRITPLKGE